MTTITVAHVSKRLGTNAQPVQAIDNLSLKITSGEVIAVVGPSGCGKSTLLRLIAGLAEPDSGHILYDNVPLSDIPLTERGVGMVFQEGALVPHWEAEKSVSFFYRLRHREQEVPSRVSEISKITGFGLEKLLSRRPGHLSGGEKQRVSIARALTRDPRVFLFDEPFSNLDAKLRGAARIELKRLLDAFPVTSVYVTHDQIEAVALAKRVAVMRAGKIEQMGNYQTLYHNPTNLFVATFIGTPPINLFEGRAREGQWHGAHFSGLPLRSDLAQDTKVILGIRPEFVKLTSENADGAAAGIVSAVTPFYAERFQLIEVAAGKESWLLSAAPDIRISKGETVWCSFDREGIFYFDVKTGQRIG